MTAVEVEGVAEVGTVCDQSGLAARKLLVDWANSQDSWVRAVVAAVLASRRAPSEAVLDTIFDGYLVEKGLAEGTLVAVPEIILDVGRGTEAASFAVETLEGVRGVNALAPEQAIKFNAGMTVFFGENGTGKTGYTRIFKQLAAARTVETIVPNVHDSAASVAPEAIIAYQVGGESVSLKWQGEAGVAPFTHLSVFDSSALHLHVDEDLTYVYTPGDLAYFPMVSAALGGVKARLDAAVKARTPGGNPHLGLFIRGTAVCQLIEALGAPQS